MPERTKPTPLSATRSRSRLLGFILTAAWATPVLAEPAKQAAESPKAEATVVVRSTKPGAIISRVTEQSFAAGGVPGGFATLHGESWVDLCMAPCEIELPPGLVQLKLSGDGFTSTYTHVDLRSGRTDVEARPGSSTLLTLGIFGTVFGTIGVMLGGSLWGIGAAMGEESMEKGGMITTLASLPVVGLGVLGISSGSSSLEANPRAAAVRSFPRARGFTVRGTF